MQNIINLTLIKQTILTCLLGAGAVPATADWTKVSDEGSFAQYVDYDTIRKDGNLRKVWALHDNKKRDEDGEMSTRFRMELDCKEERTRTLSISSHSQNMAGGALLRKLTQENPKWKDVVPNSVGDTILKIACKKP